jgi:hypothetical protein
MKLAVQHAIKHFTSDGSLSEEFLMSPVVLSIGILFLFATGGAAPAPEKEPPPAVATAKKLAKPVRFPGWDKDERMTLQDGLNQLTELYELRFSVNEHAFKAEVPPVPEVLNTAVASREPLPKMDKVPLETVLRRVLSWVPSTSGTTFTIRRGEIEITTEHAQRLEFWGENYRGPFFPLVQVAFERRSLEDALKELADSADLTADFNIVLDARAAEKAKTPVTARLINVPLDTAVRLLADMADLKPFLVDNVIYVTTKENHAELQKEEKRRMRSAPSTTLPSGPSPAEPQSGPRVGVGRSQATPPPPPPPLLP